MMEMCAGITRGEQGTEAAYMASNLFLEGTGWTSWETQCEGLQEPITNRQTWSMASSNTTQVQQWAHPPTKHQVVLVRAQQQWFRQRVYGPTYPNTKTELGKKTDLRQMTCMPKQNSFRFFYFHTYTYCTLTIPPFSPTFAYPFKKKKSKLKLNPQPGTIMHACSPRHSEG